VSVATAGPAIAPEQYPEQYIAIRTASGFIGMDGNGCCAFLEAYERLDFFKALPLPFAGIMFILCADVERRFCASGF
jgi:hypothetical protein